MLKPLASQTVRTQMKKAHIAPIASVTSRKCYLCHTLGLKKPVMQVAHLVLISSD